MTKSTPDFTSSADANDLTSTSQDSRSRHSAAESTHDDGRVSLAPLAPEDVLRAMLATRPAPDRQD